MLIIDWLTMCLYSNNKGGFSCSGVTEDEILSPLRQMEGCRREGGRHGWGGGDIFLRQKRMAVSGKATMSSHLTHNPI